MLSKLLSFSVAGPFGPIVFVCQHNTRHVHVPVKRTASKKSINSDTFAEPFIVILCVTHQILAKSDRFVFIGKEKSISNYVDELKMCGRRPI